MRPIPLSHAADRWKKNFDRAVLEATLSRRFLLEDHPALLGKRKEDRFFLMRKEKRLFALLPPVLRVRLVKKEGGAEAKLCFSRPLFPAAVLLAWAVLMMGTGLFFLTSELETFFVFFLPGVLGILPFVWYNRKKKEKLLAAFREILETDAGNSMRGMKE
jgi:hypothetical protein